MTGRQPLAAVVAAVAAARPGTTLYAVLARLAAGPETPVARFQSAL